MIEVSKGDSMGLRTPWGGCRTLVTVSALCATCCWLPLQLTTPGAGGETSPLSPLPPASTTPRPHLVLQPVKEVTDGHSIPEVRLLHARQLSRVLDGLGAHNGAGQLNNSVARSTWEQRRFFAPGGVGGEGGKTCVCV